MNLPPKTFIAATLLVFILGLKSIGAEKSPGRDIVLEADGARSCFSTLEAALEASRDYPEDTGKSITISAGKYFLEEPLVLDGRDAGLVIKAIEGESVVLLGGRLLGGWVPCGDKFWVADAPGTETGEWDFRSLIVNGRYADRARYPESGRLYHENTFNVRWRSTAEGGWERPPTRDELTRMHFKPGDLGDWVETKNAELTIYHQWDETLVGVAAIDTKNHVLTTSIPSGHPIGCFGFKDYVLWNVKEGMTRPGQWYLDRVKGQVVYWPLEDENIETVEAVAPVLETVIQLTDTRDVTLKGLKVQSTNTRLMKGDFGAKLFEGAISARNADDCLFEDLEVSFVTGWGMKLFGDNLTVKECHVHHLGAGGIRLIGSHALIEDNYIHHVGMTYPSAILLYIGSTDPNMLDEWEFGKDETHAVVRHNELHDGPYIGLGIGGSHHTITYNKVYRVMQELKDGAALYGTFCDNLVLSHNLVRDLKEDSKISAYYLDELSDKALVANNISINVYKPLQNHMASGNTFRNNIFISNGPLLVSMARCRDYLFEKNVFVARGPVKFTAPDDEFVLVDNWFDVPSVQKQSISENYKRGPLTEFELPDGNGVGDAGLVINGDDISFEGDAGPDKKGVEPIMGSKAGLHPVDALD